MQEIKCPKCGEVFQVDESGYAAILKQVRDSEFNKEVLSHKAQFEAEKENAIKFSKLEAEKNFAEVVSKKDAEITELKNKLQTFDIDKKLELSELEAKLNIKLAERENSISKLQNEKILAEKESQLKEQSIREQYEAQLRFKDEEIERYKDFKARLSTKMIGESLEQHCETEFNKLRATAFQKSSKR